MERTLLSGADLCERWGVSAKTIDGLRATGLLVPREHFGAKILYPIDQVKKLEGYEDKNITLDMLKEREEEVKRLTKENRHLRKSLAELSRALYEDVEDDGWR